MKSLFDVGAKHIHFMNRTRLIVRLAGNEENSSRKLAYIDCFAPTLKSDFMYKFRRLVVTKLDNYFIPFSEFHLLNLIFFQVGFIFFLKIMIEKIE